MSAAVYRDDKTFKKDIQILHNHNWNISSISNNISLSKDKKLSDVPNTILFEKRHNDNSVEYAFAYAGTKDIADGIQDVLQLKGLSPEYAKAVSLSKKIKNSLSNSVLTFVGHSYGGGKAAISSMATGCKAITFNPAALSPQTILNNMPLGKGDITNFISTTPSILGIHLITDYVTRGQNFIHLVAPGIKKPIPTGWTPTHSIDTIVNTLAHQ